jgi:hypothetical protein
LPALASGELIACYAVAEGPKPVTPANLATRVHHGALSGAKVPVADGDVADMAIVLAHDGSGHASLFISDLRGDGVTRTRVETLDPTQSHAELTFEQAPIERLGDDGQGWRHNEALFDRAAVLFAFEQVGGAQACLDMARDYAMGRYAFGRPIASFQAIKHRMADMYCPFAL